MARIGGDEFAVLLLQAGENITSLALKRIREAEMQLRADNGPIKVCFSLGSATATIPEEIDGLLHQADMRMYEDKATHKLSCKKKIESETQTGKFL